MLKEEVTTNFPLAINPVATKEIPKNKEKREAWRSGATGRLEKERQRMNRNTLDRYSFLGEEGGA